MQIVSYYDVYIIFLSAAFSVTAVITFNHVRNLKNSKIFRWVGYIIGISLLLIIAAEIGRTRRHISEISDWVGIIVMLLSLIITLKINKMR